MYAIAIIGDLLSFIPGVNIVSGVITGMLLWIAGEITGVRIFSSSGFGWTGLAIVIEMAPFVAMIPAWTIRVYIAKEWQEQEEDGV